MIKMAIIIVSRVIENMMQVFMDEYIHRITRCPVFNRTVRYFGSFSGIKMIVIPDTACVNSSIFLPPTLALSISGIFERATWQPKYYIILKV